MSNGRDDRDRAERLVVHDVRLVGDVGEQGRLEEEAAVAALAAGEHARALGLGVLDQRLDRVGAAAVGERAHLHAVLEAVADLHLGGALGEALDERVVDAALDVEAGRRDAHLAGVPELLRHDHVERLFEVAIVEDQHRRVAAELHRHAGHAVGAQAHQMLADVGRAGEADLADDAAGDERLADQLASPWTSWATPFGDAGVGERAEQLGADSPGVSCGGREITVQPAASAALTFFASR